MLPPTSGSKTVATIGAPSRLCSGGLKSPNRSVKTAIVRSIGASTTMRRWTIGASLGHRGSLVGGSTLSMTTSP